MSAQKIAFDLAASGETDLAKFVQAGMQAKHTLVQQKNRVLHEIANCETSRANATVKRMARLARNGLASG